MTKQLEMTQHGQQAGATGPRGFTLKKYNTLKKVCAHFVIEDRHRSCCVNFHGAWTIARHKALIWNQRGAWTIARHKVLIWNQRLHLSCKAVRLVVIVLQSCSRRTRSSKKRTRRNGATTRTPIPKLANHHQKRQRRDRLPGLRLTHFLCLSNHGIRTQIGRRHGLRSTTGNRIALRLTAAVVC